MRIIKLQIYNFKGVKEKRVIDFSSSLTILRGPNGFGKTTIFDAIELCLTGSMQRAVNENKLRVTNDIKDYKDAFYRNTPNKDVVLKLLVENWEGERKTIVKRLSFDHTGDFGGANSKRFKVKDSLEGLDTYFIGEADFDDDNFYNVHDALDRGSSEIQEWLFGKDNQLNIKDIYKLFGYIQQEENTFYLKLSESKRKSELDFLYNSQDQAEELKVLENNIAQLRKVRDAIKNELESLHIEQSSSNAPEIFEQVFDFIDLRLDTLSPFEDDTPRTIDESYKSIRDYISRIDTFVKLFDYQEYNKAVKKQRLIDLSKNNDFQEYFVLQTLLEDEKYNDITSKYSLLTSSRDTNLIDYYLLQRFVQNDMYSNMQLASAQHIVTKSYLDKDYITVESKLEAIVKIDVTELVSVDEIIKGTEYLAQLKERQKMATELGGLMAVLSETRKSLADNFQSINKHHDHKDKACPFCGHDWESYDNLLAAISEKSEKYKEINSAQVKAIEKLTADITSDFINPIEERLKLYSEKTKRGYGFFTKLSSIKNSVDEEDFRNFSERIEILIPESKDLIWSEIKTSTALTADKINLQELIKQAVPFDSKVIEKLNELKGYKFESSIKLVADELRVDFVWEAIEDSSRLGNDSDKLQKMLVDRASEIELDGEKLGGVDRSFFKDIFKNEFENIEKVKGKLEAKITYIEYKYSQKKNGLHVLLSSRYKKVTSVHKKTENLKIKYKNTLNEYKNSMTESIKIPFHIYSARILQNYSQGYGAFVSTPSQNTSSIRFLTGSGSDHDLVHQLSSGQLAVISMAFSLAINKVYGSASLKFLAIDDPVQELDILNVYSFVELLRNDFAGKYQLILSTHDDLQADYIEYRFHMINEPVEPVRVQDVFFPSQRFD